MSNESTELQRIENNETLQSSAANNVANNQTFELIKVGGSLMTLLGGLLAFIAWVFSLSPLVFIPITVIVISLAFFGLYYYRIVPKFQRQIEGLEGNIKSLEDKQTALLESKEVEKTEKPLRIKVKEIYEVSPSLWGDNEEVFITIVLTVTNKKPEINSIEDCKLWIDYKNNERIEGELQEITYFTKSGKILELEGDKDEKGERFVFTQGLAEIYFRTFKVKGNTDMFDKEATYSDRDFVIELTDSYENSYTINDRTPKSIKIVPLAS